jgi:endonuclease/exonuclease/phosphatase (EEP) superfamily protein YafD
MTEQNFKNHTRLIPIWHYVTAAAILALLGGSIVNLCDAEDDSFYSAALLVLVSLILLVIYWYARAFALKAQDRAIRAEENLRHFILTGKALPKELRMGQIIGLRFASDEEFPSLAQKAVAENLSQKQIKQAIQNWKADYNRV